jgi:hypothetical protein
MPKSAFAMRREVSIPAEQFVHLIGEDVRRERN